VDSGKQISNVYAATKQSLSRIEHLSITARSNNMNTKKNLNLQQPQVTGAITFTKAKVVPSDLWPNPRNHEAIHTQIRTKS
jgi:hypothetical protein